MTRPFLLTAALLLGACSEYDLQVEGEGVDEPLGPQPDIEVTPTEISFGEKLPDCPTDPRFVTVKNVGEAPLEVTDITLSGDASAFTFLAAPLTLAPGESAEIQVDFLAATTVTYDADLEIHSNDPDEDLVAVDLAGEGSDKPSNEDIFQQASPESVDVLWVLDNSCSMSDKVAALETSFDTFIGSFVQLGLDYQIAVTTTDMDDPTQQGRLQGPTPVMSSTTMSSNDIIAAFDAAVDPNSSGSGSEKPLEAAYAALESPGYAKTAGLVRQDAGLAVIIVSDEDDSSGQSAAFYQSWLDGYKVDPDDTSFSGIIQQNASLFSMTCSGTGSPKLQSAIDQTGGLRASICDATTSGATASPAFQQVLTWLSFTAAGLTTQFELTDTPAAGAAGMSVTIDGNPINFDPLGQGGWSYNVGLNAVFFHGSAIPGPQQTVVVTYPVDGQCPS